MILASKIRWENGMDIAQLEVFLAVAEEKSFSRAGHKLFRTQAAISQAIRKLESDVGEVLFDRSFKDGRLTDAGQVLLEYAHKVINLRTEAHAALQELRSLHQGKLLIGANEYTAMYLLSVLANYRQLYPQIKVEVQRCRASEIPMKVLRHDLDIGALTYQPQQSGLRSIVAAQDTIALVVAPTHHLAKRQSVSIRDLEMESLTAHNVVSPYRRKVIEMFQRYKTPLNIGMELPSIEAIKRFIQISGGIGILPRLCVEIEVSHKSLVAIPIKEMKLKRKLHLVHRQNAGLSHAAQAFLRLAQSRLTG
ncbi:MAG: LysR family transcriptional regulator, partial [Acidobacteriota bacterium]